MITGIIHILFVLFCETASRIFTFIFTPGCMIIHHLFGGDDWRTRRNHFAEKLPLTLSETTPRLLWLFFVLSVLIFWAGILENHVFYGNHVKVANGMLILSSITLAPVVIWWVRNRKTITDIRYTIHMNHNQKKVYSIISVLLFLLQLFMPFLLLGIGI